MDRYFYDMRDVLKNVLSPDELEDLRDAMAVAYRVEYLGGELASQRPGSKFVEIEMVAGKFRAIATKIRAT